MATTKQRQAARRNVKKAQKAAPRKKHRGMTKATRSALGKQASAVAQRKRRGGTHPKTRSELIKIAQRRGLEGRSKMGRDEFARALAER